MTEIASATPMIGVLAQPDDHDTVREFFELFKTPWEFCRRDRNYRVLLVADGTPIDRSAELMLVYGSRSTAFDQACNRIPGSPRSKTIVSWDGQCIPIYGNVVGFGAAGRAHEVILPDTAETVVWVRRVERQTFVRVGYDLF